MGKKKVLAATSLGMASLAVITACGTAITSGTVMGKQDVPAHDTVMWVPHYHTVCGVYLVYSSYRKAYVNTSRCHSQYTYSIPVPQYVPEEWRLHIHDGQQDGWVDVSEITYNDQAIGSHWQAVEGS